MKAQINRKSHAGKSANEREAYKNFLSGRFKLDKTEEDPENLRKTDSSTFDKEDVEQIRPQGKSWMLKVKDFFSNNIVETIIGGLVLAIIIGAFTLIIRQGVQDEKITNLDKKVEKIDEKIDTLSGAIETTSRTVDVLRAEVGKDIQYIKERLKNVKY